MNNLHRTIGISLFLIFAAFFGAFADGPAGKAPVSVVILPFENGTGSPAYDAACGTALGILSFTLKSLDDCAVTVLDSDPVARDDADLKAWADSGGVDIALYGEVLSGADDSLKVRLSAFNRASGATIATGETDFVSVLSLFGACDALSLSVVSGMTGTHIGFARIDFVNVGEKGSYEILIDGKLVGKDLSSIAGWREGRREIVVRQSRMSGNHELYRKTADLVEGIPFIVNFSIPLLLPKEREQVTRLESEIRDRWDMPESAKTVDDDIAAYAALFARTDYCYALSEYRARAAKFASDREVYKQSRQLQFLALRVTELEKSFANLSSSSDANSAGYDRLAKSIGSLAAGVRSCCSAERDRAARDLQMRKNLDGIGRACLIAGIAGCVVFGASYGLGYREYQTYKSATTNSEADASRAKVGVWNALAIAGAGMGGAGLVLAPVFYLSGPAKATALQEKDSADAIIEALDSKGL
jgi:hypothetical protein